MDRNIDKYLNFEDITEPIWKKIIQKKILFGHQSVGNNIIKGIREIIKEKEWSPLRMIDVEDIDETSNNYFSHCKIGNNSDPISKLDAFVKLFEKIISNKIDIAFFKFCFVDIKHGTNLDNLFDHYVRSFDKLKELSPYTKFIHVTVPLNTLKVDFRTIIKKIMKKNIIWEYDNLVSKNKFNEMIISRFKDEDPIYDLASAEAAYDSSKKVTFHRKNRRYLAMAPEYTNDGGHLNEIGRKAAAKNLICLLANHSDI